MMIRDFPRALRMFESVLNGATFDECGQKFGVTGGRVQQLIKRSASILRSRAFKRGETVPAGTELYVSDLRRNANWYRQQIEKALS